MNAGITAGSYVGVGTFVGRNVGGKVGTFVGLEVGGTVGIFVGREVGGFVGVRVGLVVLGFDVTGMRVGFIVGEAVTTSQEPIVPFSGKNGHQYEVSGSLARSQSSA